VGDTFIASVKKGSYINPDVGRQGEVRYTTVTPQISLILLRSRTVHSSATYSTYTIGDGAARSAASPKVATIDPHNINANTNTLPTTIYNPSLTSSTTRPLPHSHHQKPPITVPATMDAGDDAINISQEDIQRLSPSDQRDLQQFMQAKQQEANFQRSKLPLPIPILCMFFPRLTSALRSNPRTHRNLLQEVHHPRQHLVGPSVGQRVELHDKLRGPLHGQ